jgi:hypothetical protein
VLSNIDRLTILMQRVRWAIFHVVGANPKMKSMYQWYQIMICLLKFDFFFFTGVTMQVSLSHSKFISANHPRGSS